MSDARHLSFKYLCLLPCKSGQLNPRALYLHASQLVDAKATRQTMNRQRIPSIRLKKTGFPSFWEMIYLSPPSSPQKQHTMPMRTPWIGDLGSKILPSYSSLPFPLPKQVSVSARPLLCCPGCSGSPCIPRSLSLTIHAEGWLLCPTEGKLL